MTRVRGVLTVALVLALIAPAFANAAQATQSATEFYQAYRKVLAKAQKIEDLLPMMSASRRKQIDETAAEDRKMMFGMVKEMTAEQGPIKVVKETPTATGVELAVVAKDGTGVVTLTKEGGGWKVDKESWKSK